MALQCLMLSTICHANSFDEMCFLDKIIVYEEVSHISHFCCLHNTLCISSYSEDHVAKFKIERGQKDCKNQGIGNSDVRLPLLETSA